MGNYGVKIAQPGYGVGTTDPRNLVFSSAYQTLNVALSGSAQNTQNGGSYTFTISHSLGFIPFVQVFYKTSVYSNDWVMAPANFFGANINGDLTNILHSSIRVTSSDVKVIVDYLNGVSETITIKYYIFNIAI